MGGYVEDEEEPETEAFEVVAVAAAVAAAAPPSLPSVGSLQSDMLPSMLSAASSVFGSSALHAQGSPSM